MPERVRLSADDVEKLHSPTSLGPQAGQVQYLGECLEGAGRLRSKPDMSSKWCKPTEKSSRFGAGGPWPRPARRSCSARQQNEDGAAQPVRSERCLDQGAQSTRLTASGWAARASGALVRPVAP